MKDVMLHRSDDLPDGAAAWWCPDSRVVLLDVALTRIEARSCLAHELAHLELEHQACDGYQDQPRVERRQEQEADVWAARRLLEIRPMAHVLMWTSNVGEAAAELWVTPSVLQVRLEHLHPAERHYLARCQARREEAA